MKCNNKQLNGGIKKLCFSFFQLLIIAYLGSDADWSEYDCVELLKKHGKRFEVPPLVDQGDADEWMESNLKPDHLAEACAEIGQEIVIRYQKV